MDRLDNSQLDTLRAMLDERERELREEVRALKEAGAERPSAAELFAAMYRLEELKRATSALFGDLDLLLLPTAPTVYTRAEIEREPLALNARLGRYTNFVNLLDLSAVAVPAEIAPSGLPFGVSLIGPAGSDPALLAVAARFHASAGLSVGATE